MLRLVNILLLSFSISVASTLVGAGGYDVTKKEDTYTFKDKESSLSNANITEVLQKKSKNTNSVTMWITRHWEEDWYSIETTQKEIIDKGFTPIYIFYWFADEISPKFVQENEEKYFKSLRKFTQYMKKLKGKKIVVLNPEYNMSETGMWDGMNDLFLESFKMLREDKEVLVGPCVGDFGNYTLINEVEEWKRFDKSLFRAAKEADFIAFQEMRALTRNSKDDILKTPQRALNLSRYLYKTYKKPTMLAYVAISSYGKNGEEIQENVYKNFVETFPKMKKDAKLMFFGIFHYFDYPGHVGYFNEAEEFFGIIRKDGTVKPSFIHFNNLNNINSL
ncbi:hypothetical protein KKG72_11305 [bacterium]|nr:hypothetical protein [bacterium]MBU1994671.1 hypothetical protein [bacterium]